MLITLKKSLIYEDISQNHSDFFNTLIQNMIKRCKFYNIAKLKIDELIKRGRDIAFDLEKIRMLKNELKTIAPFNYNKQCFYIGLQDLINHNIVSIKSSKDINVMKQKLSLRISKNENLLEEIFIPKKQISIPETFNEAIIDDEIKLSEQIEPEKKELKAKKARIRSTIQLLKLEQLKELQEFNLKSDPKFVNSKTLNVKERRSIFRSSSDLSLGEIHQEDSDNSEDEKADQQVVKKSFMKKLSQTHEHSKLNVNLNGYQSFIRKLSRMNLTKLKKRNIEIENKEFLIHADRKLDHYPVGIEKIDEVNEEEIQANYDKRSSSTSLSIYNPKFELQVNNMVKELKAIKIQNIDIQKCILNLIKAVNSKDSELESSYSDSAYTVKKKHTIRKIATKNNNDNKKKDSESSLKVSQDLLNDLSAFNIGI